MTAVDRVRLATAASHCTRAVRGPSAFATARGRCSRRRQQKVGHRCCARKSANQELLRGIAKTSSWKSLQSPQRAMTFLKQLFWRDIFGSSYCHNEIHRADSSGWFISFCGARCCAQSRKCDRRKCRCKKPLRAHVAYDFLTPVAAPRDLEKRTRARGQSCSRLTGERAVSGGVRVKRRFQ
jgi:hypothetical protein